VMPTPTPKFRKPPVIEVALSVQFEPLTKLKVAHLGLLQQEFKNFPSSETYLPLAPVEERFDIPKGRATPRIEVTQLPPFPRSWFINEDGSSLIQIQQDRFVHNWRKVSKDDEYPNYDTISKRFVDLFEKFEHFLNGEKLGSILPVQCEVTYVNHILPNALWKHHGEAHAIFTVFRSTYSDDFLKQPEDVRIALRYLYKNTEGVPIGRLHMNADPGYAPDESPVIVLVNTARGPAIPPNREGVMAFLDRGHEWIVRGFASVTTTEMHEQWERYQ
jgi:uncharacterized protein (TIGR04255 family)